MLSLLKNEFYKVFHKKSTYIVLIIIFLYACLVNYIYNRDVNNVMEYYYSPYILSAEEEQNYKETVKNYNPNTSSKDEYVYALTVLDISKNLKLYEKDSCQYEFLNDEYYYVAYNYYSIDVFNNNDTGAKKTYDEYNQALSTGDWKYFVNLNIVLEEATIAELKQNLSNVSDKEIKNYEADLYAHEEKLMLLKYVWKRLRSIILR